ncbi:glycine betaine ABC transporter substrate-binding protein [Bacillus marinisedimentorum]|uniref:glycine betaine ABC transporter substrate-binding protein n=1 Tax=Bacillus marinisedimentorum TaxID=1821260 RepID=UPI0007E17191|nr:glycine betaine ABC transporter substrate-binding protein [Bacillus marinisedimentorum]
MPKLNWKKLGLTAGLSLSLIVAGCGGGEEEAENNKNGGSEGGESASVAEQLDHTITGIDAGAGVMQAAEDAIEKYGLDSYELQASSSAAMTQALTDAIEAEEAIVVTGWTPHWKFSKYDLKYLDDPEGVFGGEEKIHTIARKGLEGDMPNAYKILDQFNWETSDMESVMLEVNEGADPEEAAANWIKENEEKVAEWTEGAEEVDGKEISLAYVAWDSEIASTNLIATVLEDMGFKVDMTQVEAAPMWAAVANGDADAIVAAWLPGTHAAYMEDYEADVEDLGPNLEGAKVGLVVPSYMEIDSIEDLKAEE